MQRFNEDEEKRRRQQYSSTLGFHGGLRSPLDPSKKARGAPLPEVTFRGAFASSHGTVQILPAVTLRGTCSGEPEPEPEPEARTICGTAAARHAVQTQGGTGSDCQCVNGWWSRNGHGHDCAQVRRCDPATQWQSTAPSPTNDAQCSPLTDCRPDEVMVAAPTYTSNRRC